MIKKLNIEETPFSKKPGKLSLFRQDLIKIINDRIEYCEFIDFPYASSTSISELQYKARQLCRDLLWQITGRNPKDVEYFAFSKLSKEDGYHFYAKFDVKEWEKAIKGDQNVI